MVITKVVFMNVLVVLLSSLAGGVGHLLVLPFLVCHVSYALLRVTGHLSVTVGFVVV